MEHRKGDPADHGEHRGRHEVRVGHAERVAEQQLLEALRRVGAERQQRAEAHQAGDHHAGGGLRADARVAGRDGDQRGGHRHAAGRPEQQRRPGERGEHEPRQEPVRERLGRVRQPLDHDPEAERPADRPEQGHLEHCAAVDAGAERIQERVEQVHGQCGWWCWIVTMRSGPASRSTISSWP